MQRLREDPELRRMCTKEMFLSRLTGDPRAAEEAWAQLSEHEILQLEWQMFAEARAHLQMYQDEAPRDFGRDHGAANERFLQG